MVETHDVKTEIRLYKIERPDWKWRKIHKKQEWSLAEPLRHMAFVTLAVAAVILVVPGAEKPRLSISNFFLHFSFFF